MKMKKICMSTLFLLFCCASFAQVKEAIEDAKKIVKEVKKIIHKNGYKPNSKKSYEAVEEADFDEDIFENKLPKTLTLEGPPILSQEETSQCVAFSCAYYIMSMYNGVKGTKNTRKALSPQYAYAQYKKVNNDDDCDNGCFLFSDKDLGIIGMSEILKKYGTTTMDETPFEDTKDCIVLSANQVNKAKANRISDFYRLDKKEFSKTQELKSWLYAGYPLWFGVDVEENWDSIGTDIWKSSKGEGSGHAMVITGYDDEKNAFKVANSWGTEFGDNGYGWIDYEFLHTLLSTQADAEIGVVYPNKAQKAVFNKLSPGSCGNAGYGNLKINNERDEEIAVVMSGDENYVNDDAGNIDANKDQIFSGIRKGEIKVKIYNADKSTLIKEYTVTVTQCEDVVLDVK